MGVTSLVIYALLLMWFYFGYKVSSKVKSKNPRPVKEEINLVVLLHKVTLVLSLISVIFVLIHCLEAGISIKDNLLSGQGNVFKDVVYSKAPIAQVMIMARHLILTSFITWFILYKNEIHIKTLPLIIFSSAVLFLFTSSRLTIMAILLICFLYYFVGRNRIKIKLYVFVLAVIGLFVVFGLGVIYRSIETWQIFTGEDNIFIIVATEFIGYFISPVNYSIALVEGMNCCYLYSVVKTFFCFILTVFNIEDVFSITYLDNIKNFYNPSLNQIGLVGLWFTGFGPFLFIPSFLFGFISGIAYRSYNSGSLNGLLFYPLIYFTIFDSFRGFLMTQNVIISNILFISIFLLLYRIYIRFLKND